MTWWVGLGATLCVVVCATGVRGTARAKVLDPTGGRAEVDAARLALAAVDVGRVDGRADVLVAAAGVDGATKAGRAVRVALGLWVWLRSAFGALPALAMPTTMAAHPTTATQDTVAETARAIDM